MTPPRNSILASLLDGMMERRSDRLMALIGEWLPSAGPVLDLGSGTGHFAERIERERELVVVTADVSDIHRAGPAPVLIADDRLPFESEKFTATLLVYMLHYPPEPVALLAEAARVTRGPLILVQSLHDRKLGYAWLRVREFLWTYLAFHISRYLGYVARGARFTMAARRFYTIDTLERDLAAAGLRIRARRERRIAGRALVVAGCLVERVGTAR